MSDSNPDKQYVSILNLRDRRNKSILAGTPFRKYIMIGPTFDKLFENEEILPYNAEDKPVIVSPLKGESKVQGAGNFTPSAAINPKVRVEEELSDQQFDEREAVIITLKKLKVKFSPRCKLATLRNKLVDAQKAAERVKALLPTADTKEPPEQSAKEPRTAKMVWDGAPDVLEKFPFAKLQSMYRDQCVTYSLTVETFRDKKALIEKMSSEYVAK